MTLSLAACGGTSGGNIHDRGNSGISSGGGTDDTGNGSAGNNVNDANGGGAKNDINNNNGGQNSPDEGEDMNILVAYFSCTNTTKGRAEALQARLNADIYRIQPQEPYTSADLNYNNDNCRANREQRDSSARPAIDGRVENIEKYDIVYIGYPIWWGQAPKIIYTFLESYDFSGVIVIPFCTSGGSGMGTSGTNLHGSAPAAVWKSGCRVSSASDIETLVNMN